MLFIPWTTSPPPVPRPQPHPEAKLGLLMHPLRLSIRHATISEPSRLGRRPAHGNRGADAYCVASAVSKRRGAAIICCCFLRTICSLERHNYCQAQGRLCQMERMVDEDRFAQRQERWYHGVLMAHNIWNGSRVLSQLLRMHM
jgi:hypothetical protein